MYQQMGMFHKSKGNVFNDVCRMKHRGTKNRGRPKTDGDHGGGEYIWQNTQQLKTKKKGTKAWHCSEKGSCRSWRPLAPATTPGYARSWRSLGCRMQMAQLTQLCIGMARGGDNSAIFLSSALLGLKCQWPPHFKRYLYECVL